MHLMTDYTDPEHHICVRVREQRASLRADVRNQLVKAEASDPDQLADTYCLLLEGLFTAARTTAGLSATPPPSPKKRFAKAAAPVRSRLNRAGSAAGRSASQETLFLVKNGFASDVPDAKPFSRVYAFTKVKNANAKKICFSYLLYRRRVVL